ncbi:ribokinase [Limosilactobacillus fastidiosus]|uniref:Ribokinase n=1 Tax=Limosilactobacillus fastidiosus TaxID=2759855 RepID=A0A7W3TYB1_9LACO|nr:ribokinase [Limosilactobacillus fastidiosus]MBB1062542.1 ribokinase [Limosilactobacillus fastidiosus]MBB1085506.1 ribokinase [Limosilactobacillus fastidiosus]MCD7083616.1 ribokinase [Limosilactobacillus fastidiosus]MCD7085959.1 ribokinase [Limosilactobacillus fastidiosus]MCD7114397.1 ribokinase [Limosilactobacillus fastidiosus]
MVNQVIVLGSINVDSIYQVARFPQPGETISVKQKSYAPGGKGANQAVAAARSGARVSFIGAVGADNDGQEMIKTLAENDIDTSGIAVDPDNGTGSAVITVDENGQNDIMVYGGANQAMTKDNLDDLPQRLSKAKFIVAQLETPQEVTLAAFKLAKQQGVITILNPAPANELIPELLDYTDVIVPNETESELLSGIAVNDEESLLQNAEFFKRNGVENIIITLGERGAFYTTENEQGLIPAFKVKAVDTTAAGDTFIGALVSQLDTDLRNLEVALTYAQRASSLTVQGMGAMPSIPLADEVRTALKE